MEEKDFKEISNLLNQAKKNIVIIPHKNPDGDAMGSSLGIKLYLEKKGHTAKVIAPSSYPEFLHWLPSNHQVAIYDPYNKDQEMQILQADMIFAMDYNSLSRIDEMQGVVERSTAYKVMIDHHQQPDDFPNFTYSDTSICSTCQMLYQFIDILGDTHLIDKDIATCIYTGILTDTGSFKFDSTTSKTHRIAAELMDKGANNFEIHSRVFDNKSLDKLKLQGLALQNLQVVSGVGAAYIFLTKENLRSCNYKKGDSEGLVNMALSVEGINLAGIFIEDLDNDFIKISLRSKGKFSVNQLSRDNFNGGGHINAAGGRFFGSLEQSIKKFVLLAEQYKEEIKNSYE